MNLKRFVAIGLLVSLLVAGLILIYGYSSRTLLPVLLLSFLLAFFAIIIYVTRNSLEDKIFLTSMLLILVAISATFFLTNHRTHYDIINDYIPNSEAEISLMQSQNQYNIAYANYLNQVLQEHQANIQQMETQLTELNKRRLEQVVYPVPIVTTPVIIVPEDYYINYDYDDYEIEGEDD